MHCHGKFTENKEQVKILVLYFSPLHEACTMYNVHILVDYMHNMIVCVVGVVCSFVAKCCLILPVLPDFTTCTPYSSLDFRSNSIYRLYLFLDSLEFGFEFWLVGQKVQVYIISLT